MVITVPSLAHSTATLASEIMCQLSGLPGFMQKVKAYMSSKDHYCQVAAELVPLP